ncbi:MAG: DUF805 domain-containing protein [Klebsiella huaxiensis]|uniref:DUF805 domain-containing protein n=1 Tax=Klebsiella huaxiensis TaxID=2153354 RepID=UPI0026EA4343|nr:DUF805 domain-containing protein [Klebsiella huaxiensis]WEJ87425.1 MAG: DUF805 domain-containing protein [Klebsiella huaxiensis]
MNEFKKVMFENYFNMKGRASRREFWMYTLIVFVITLVIDFIVAMVFHRYSSTYFLVKGAFSLIFLCPSVCVIVRRFHDIGKSGWWAFILLIPLIGSIILLIFSLKKGQQGSNQYGPSPLVLKV